MLYPFLYWERRMRDTPNVSSASLLNKRSIRRVALVWRADPSAVVPTPSATRFHLIFSALDALALGAEPVLYSEEMEEAVRAHLLSMDGVLVWVDPLREGKDRSRLDPLLREVAARGVWVSAHPDVILKMGVKEVLYRTRDLGWGADTDLYTSIDDFNGRFPVRLCGGGPRVLKELSLGAFMSRCHIYFAGDGKVIDQAFQPRLPEGMIRCYLTQNEVVGFGHQLVKALIPPPAAGHPAAQPGPRIMHAADAQPFQRLRWSRRLSSSATVPGSTRCFWFASILQRSLGPHVSVRPMG
jgi:hypothetical protein